MASEGTATAAPSSGASAGWKQRIIVPTVLAGIVGGGAGLISKHRKVLGAGPVAASYVVNLAVVAGCYCSAREVARDARASEPDDLVNSVVGGMASGALLGRFQGGQLGAARYAILFAAVGTALDFTAIQLRPYFESFKSAISIIKDGNPSWSLPEWSPIQVLDEEAVAAKRAREQQIYAQGTFGKLNKEESCGDLLVKSLFSFSSFVILKFPFPALICSIIGHKLEVYLGCVWYSWSF